MQPYILNSFRRISDGAIFKKTETGTHSGGYVFVDFAGNQEAKRLRDFVCDGSFNIHSVIKNTHINGATLSTIFTKNDRLSMQYGGSDIINYIKIIDSEVLLYTGITDVSRVDIRVANKYVEPITTPIAPLTTVPISIERRGPGRPTNAEVAARTYNATTNVTNYQLETLEAMILSKNTREIRLPGLLRNRKTQTLEDFLTRFFTEWNVKKITIYVDDATQQTNINKRRSLGDIYMICKYYYPNCTLKEVLTLLYVTLNNNLTGFRTSYCYTIRKRVWYYINNGQTQQIDKTQQDEFNNEFNCYINLINL